MDAYFVKEKVAREMAAYYKRVVSDMCLWVGALAGTLVACAVTALAYKIPGTWLHLYASVAWIPPLLAGWATAALLRQRIESKNPARKMWLDDAQPRDERAIR